MTFFKWDGLALACVFFNASITGAQTAEPTRIVDLTHAFDEHTIYWPTEKAFHGFSRHWKDRQLYLGTDKHGEEGVASLHFPGLHPDAARWLVDHRAIKSIGIDTPSIDYGQSRQFQSHVTLFKHNVSAFENLASLDALPAADFRVVALPTKIA